MEFVQFFRGKFFVWKDYFSLVQAGYTKKLFFLDVTYFFCYLLHNPFEMALREHGKKNIYGETPFSLLKSLGEKTGLGASSRYLELGSGRGRGVFFMNAWFNCQASGVEWVKPFVDSALGIQKLFSVHKVKFTYGDMKNVSLRNVDLVYVYSTCFTKEELQQLAEQAKSLDVGAYLVTVSSPVYTRGAHLEHVERFLAEFPWGKTEVYIQRKIHEERT